jgi:hypothetical protein
LGRETLVGDGAMDRTEYAILTVIALATVGIGVFTTIRP